MEVLTILSIIFIAILAGVVTTLIVKLYNNGGLKSKIETIVLDENGKEVDLYRLYSKVTEQDILIESLSERIDILEFEREAKGEKFIIIKPIMGIYTFSNNYTIRFLYNNKIKSEKIPICGNEKIIAKGDYLVVKKTVELDLDCILNGRIKDVDRTKVRAVFTIIDGELKEIPVELYTKAMEK